MTRPGAIKTNAAGVVFFTDNTARRVRTITVPAPVATTFTTSPAGMPLRIGGATYVSPVVLALDSGSMIQVEAPTPSAGLGSRTIFTSWNDGGAAAHTITLGASGATFTAVYSEQHQLTVAATPAGAGMLAVTPAASDGYYAAGQQVQVAATPTAGFALRLLSGDASGTENCLNGGDERAEEHHSGIPVRLHVTGGKCERDRGEQHRQFPGNGEQVARSRRYWIPAWLTVLPARGTGSTTLTFRYPVNDGPARTGTITVNGRAGRAGAGGKAHDCGGRAPERNGPGHDVHRHGPRWRRLRRSVAPLLPGPCGAHNFRRWLPWLLRQLRKCAFPVR